MDGQGLLDGLQFHYNFIFHEQIDPVTTVQLESFVTERHMELTNKGKPHLAQFIANAFAICRFQQPRPQLSMNFNRGRNDPMRDPVEIYPFRALRSSVTLHPSSLRLPLRLCVSAGNSHSLISRSRLPLQYLFQNVVLFQTIRFRDRKSTRLNSSHLGISY